MSRSLRLGTATVAGLVFGASAMLIVQGGQGLARGDDTASSVVRNAPSALTSAPTPTTGGGATTTATASEPPPDNTAPAVLAWTPGGLQTGLADAVAARSEVAAVTVVRGDPITLEGSLDPEGHSAGAAPPPGMVIDLDAIAVEPATFAPFANARDRAELLALRPGEALLGATSAELRDLTPGDRLVMTGGATVTVTVAGVVDDGSIGAAEVAVVVATGETLGVATPRYLLAAPSGAADDTVAAIHASADPTVPLRVRARGETPYLRSSDAVLPQARIKAVFGEFAHPPLAGGRDLRQDRAWVDANIVDATVPIVGRVRCHRLLIPALRGALQELADRNLAGLVQSYDGCYNPRLVRAGGTTSRHAWGAAIDLNFSGNRTGVASIQDPRLVEVMSRWGFASGDGWLVPDPGHFEYVSPPRP